MSRTDAHAPFAVRMLRGEVAHHAVHLCDGDPARCSLPDLEAGWTTGPGLCRWEWTYTGHNWCSCWMCHWHSRLEVRRAAVRAELRGQVREWNAGEREE
ncbi:hypothetical protein [Mycolicibacterium llatzerense]|uniref:hypothetical protein n=1 Tax=Mycolicibacterium llatzerense TaxID=280871 RepID=UPI0013A6A01F|nr:hypothetical protein [Mycolicibacterium llatzerense]